jgi:hypothetical protein
VGRGDVEQAARVVGPSPGRRCPCVRDGLFGGERDPSQPPAARAQRGRGRDTAARWASVTLSPSRSRPSWWPRCRRPAW